MVRPLPYRPSKEFMTEKPTNITANKKTRELTINWDDGQP
jgi:hypothetical protein